MPVNLIWRTILHFWLASRAPAVGPLDVVRTTMRVLPTDLDIYRHMNNGRYLSIADIGRFELLRRSGIFARLSENQWYPVVQCSTITHRRSLMPWQKFVLESRLIGADERAVYLEHRFMVKDEMYARLVLKGRFLKRSGGTVTVTEMARALDVDISQLSVPEWIHRWADDVALPSTRQPAPSDW